MKKQNWKIRFLWSVVVLATMLCLWSFYASYQKIRFDLLDKSQVLFQQTVHEDTDRRTKELGDAFQFSYTGGAWLERDSITVVTADTIIYLKNNKEVAQRMSPREKSDFLLQHYLSMVNPIRVELLDSVFQTTLRERAIPAQSVICYTFMGKSTYSSPDSTFYHSFTPLKEIAFGANRLIVLQAFVQIPFLYIVGKAFLSNILWLVAWAILWLIAIILAWRNFIIHILPLKEAPKEVLQINDHLLFDKTHGVLYNNEYRIELTNQKLRLFCVLLEHKGYFIETDKLKEEIWPDGSVSKDALSTTAKRLKEDLSPIPELAIESARGRGYMLSVLE